jgi:hypothetical protein
MRDEQIFRALMVASCCILGSVEGCLPSVVGTFGYWLREQCWTAIAILLLYTFAVPVILAILWSVLK